jgi:hypothetical protein
MDQNFHDISFLSNLTKLEKLEIGVVWAADPTP